MVRWMIERDTANNDHEYMQLVTIYAPHENKEVVKQENKNWTHKRELIR